MVLMFEWLQHMEDEVASDESGAAGYNDCHKVNPPLIIQVQLHVVPYLHHCL